MTAEQLVLAGGGHSHALVLRRWAMHPKLRPPGPITLINRQSTALYSGMVPGMLAGHYTQNDITIDLRRLTDQSGVGLVIADITGVDASQHLLRVIGRPPIKFERLSLNVGSESITTTSDLQSKEVEQSIAIKPLEESLAWLEQQDSQAVLANPAPFTVIGAGLAGVEIALALRRRWPKRQLQLQANPGQPDQALRKALRANKVKLIPTGLQLVGPCLLCTGSQAPAWLAASDLPVDHVGRVMTKDTLQVIGHPDLFAVGDCGVIKTAPRPPSGVWAVKAAKPLAENLERCSRNLPTRAWRPQRHALHLIGGQTSGEMSTAWAVWRNLIVGPHPWLWNWKQIIDRRFMALFKTLSTMDRVVEDGNATLIACRGCAAKLGAQSLNLALQQAGLKDTNGHAEDAAFITTTANGQSLLQSVDGFPALISDPWLNGRLTTMHACSDLWASGADVISAQAVITLPAVPAHHQQELLAQTLDGIQSALKPQGAALIGGHTLEARNLAPKPSSLGMQVTLCVNGSLPMDQPHWQKSGLQAGDVLLMSRAIGSGVLFAAAMEGKTQPQDLDAALEQMATSQAPFLTPLRALGKKGEPSSPIHACTDITGFGLLGHLSEMLSASNTHQQGLGLPPLRLTIDVEAIPHLAGAMQLLETGFASTLAPENRRAWQWLDPGANGKAPIELKFKNVVPGSTQHRGLLELIVDPQTCGPLLIACSSRIASELATNSPWHRIGIVDISE